MALKLYAYWEGSSRHWFYDACWATVLRHNPDAVILTTADVEDVIGPLPDAIKAAYVTHRCDWIRKKFIHAVGGAWVDMDFVCCESLDFLVAQAEVFDYVGYKEWNGGWMDNLFAGRKGSKILEAAADHAYAQIAKYGRKISWLGASTESLNYAFEKYPWTLFCQLPTHIVTPFSVVNPDSFLRHLNDDSEINHCALGFMTSMHTIGGYFSGKDKFGSSGIDSAEKLLESATPLGAMFRRAWREKPMAVDTTFQEFDWASINPTHIPMAMRSENLGDDIQALAACKLWDKWEMVDRDRPGDWPADAVVPLVGWWGRGEMPKTANVIVVGFHCAEEGRKKLRKDSKWLADAVVRQGFPAQCRDVYTRDFLRGLGIPAQFSGCVTLTLPMDHVGGGGEMRIDVSGGTATHTLHELRNKPYAERLALAASRLDEIKRADHIVTSRLHIWLPALAIGTRCRLLSSSAPMRERFTGYNVDATSIEGLLIHGKKPVHYQSLRGYFGYGEFYREIAETLPNGGTFVEVGVYCGRSICYMLEYLQFIGKSASVFGYDLFDVSLPNLAHLRNISDFSTPAKWRNKVEDDLRGMPANVSIHESSSAAGFHADGSVDAVFIDAAHDEESVLRDIVAWLPKVRSGGILSGHDYCKQFPGVAKAVGRAGLKIETKHGNCWAYRKP